MKTIATFLIALLLCNPTFAWSECGHHIIAVMAFDQLSPERKAELLRILKEHPRFEEDFKLPRGVENQEHWLIGRAGYWPDFIQNEDGKRFGRPMWHYQRGPTNVIGHVLDVPRYPDPLPADATLETRPLHITQAIELCRKVLRSSKESDSNKAIAICWLCNLVADAHQPCNSGSLYVESVFDTEYGDRCGKSIPTRQDQNLHDFWDNLLGRYFDEANVNRRIAEIQKTSFFAIGNPTPEMWIQDSRRTAGFVVYTPEILEQIKAIMRAETHKVPELILSDSYIKHANNFAMLKARSAARNLAQQLK